MNSFQQTKEKKKMQFSNINNLQSLNSQKGEKASCNIIRRKAY